MRAHSRTPGSTIRSLLVGTLLAALTVSWPAIPAGAADARLERAQTQRMAVQERLDGLVRTLHELQAREAQVETELSQLAAREAQESERAQGATEAVAARIRESYKRGSVDPALSLFTSSSPQQANAQAHVLGLLAKRSRAEFEHASASRIRTRVTREQVAHVAEELEARRTELSKVRAEVATLLAAAQREESTVRSRIAAEQAARERQARERAQRLAAATRPTGTRVSRESAPSRAAGPAADVSGDIACPVGRPRSYSDTWGAARSGGRRHQGTDILAPRGTPIYAYESGSITRLTNSRVGGISLYLRGDSGNLYYYTHLDGYVSGLAAGQRVSAGQHVAHNGDTGNARGTPHLHFEVMPGGGGNVNPYPYVRRACG